ncbi:MAG: hypothetical protein Q7R93_01615 [bacterium]|nr:hypothetical protein [bacterium]
MLTLIVTGFAVVMTAVAALGVPWLLYSLEKMQEAYYTKRPVLERVTKGELEVISRPTMVDGVLVAFVKSAQGGYVRLLEVPETARLGQKLTMKTLTLSHPSIENERTTVTVWK